MNRNHCYTGLHTRNACMYVIPSVHVRGKPSECVYQSCKIKVHLYGVRVLTYLSLITAVYIANQSVIPFYLFIWLGQRVFELVYVVDLCTCNLVAYLQVCR